MTRTPPARALRTFALLLLGGCASRGAPAAASGAAGAAGAPSREAPLPATATGDLARWRRTAENVTIVRDSWGIAHVHGKSDADAVFGLMYAQAEDDFNRVETNFLTSLGRVAQAEGEKAIWQDLRQRLFVNDDTLRVQYAASPEWLRRLMDSWADGLNFYLATHPAVTPRAIRRFEPWMALSFSEGSIGGDIEDVSLKELEAFYGTAGAGRTGVRAAGRAVRVASVPDETLPPRYVEPTGSNGFAIAPSNTAAHHALLLINPHTSFFFRSEVKVESDEGLDAYGAVTWGQFFVYQGFNAKAGWMHTSSGVDAVDEFAETVTEQGGRRTYRYGAEQRPVASSTITVPYRAAGGAMAERTFTVYRTHHGPIVRAADGKWIAVALMNKPVEALS